MFTCTRGGFIPRDTICAEADVVGIDRTSKFAVTQLVERADRKTAWEFLQLMLEAVPYHVHTILTPLSHMHACVAGPWTTASSSLSNRAIDFAKAHIEPAIKPNRVRNDLGWKTMTFVVDRRSAHQR